MHRLVESHDSLFTILVLLQLSEKLQPVFTMLNQIEGAFGYYALLKQGGDNEVLQEK